jgi:glutamate dehydrogenase/leucine dehydrogenase
MPAADKERTIRAFASAIEPLTDYIPGPDMRTDETAMAWIHDEIGRSVGLPRELGAIPLDGIGATVFGVAATAEATQEFSGVALEGARVVIQGFGAVGWHSALFLAKKGVRLIEVADSKSAFAEQDGLDLEALMTLGQLEESIVNMRGANRIPAEDLVVMPCDIWIPGGVTCATVEFAGGTETGAFKRIRGKVAVNTRSRCNTPSGVLRCVGTGENGGGNENKAVALVSRLGIAFSDLQ